MAERRPFMILILRIAGGLALVFAILFGIAAFQAESVNPVALLLAAGAVAAGLFLLGFASNLVLLHQIRRKLSERGDRNWY